MRKFLTWLLLLAALGALWQQLYDHKDRLGTVARILRQRAFPCSSPITYSIGGIDPGYTISREELAAALREAETAWEIPARSELFEFVLSSGDVTVDLIYDGRQASLDRLKKLGIKTDQSLESYKELKARYEGLSARVALEQARLKGIIERYRQREAAYNAQVQRLNLQTGVSAADAWRIKSARVALGMQFDSIKRIEDAVNADVDTLNALGTTLNQLIVQLNINVDQYNRAGSIIGRHEEGLYIISNGIRTIEIYKYTGQDQLVSLLAHELGHALGLEHVPGTESLMYPINNGGALLLTQEDTAELNRACRRKK